MKVTLCIPAAALAVLTCAAPAVALAGPGDHPRIEDVSYRWRYDRSIRRWKYVVDIDVTIDGYDVIPATVTHESFNPSAGFYSTSLAINGPGVVDQGQITDFGYYTRAILNCDDADPSAHVYDLSQTWNPLGALSIHDLALILGQLRFQSFGCSSALPPPTPPPAICDAAAAPTILDFEPDSVSFFYVTIGLQGGQEVQLGFEYDGDEWAFAEQYGGAGTCQGQLDTFAAYTLSILTSPSCAAATVYTPAEEATIAWYVQEVENACQDNLPPSCSPVLPLALTPADASSIPTTPNGCGTTAWCSLSQLRAWTIPLCLATEPTVTQVVDLVLTVDQENSSLPWGTVLDRSGLQGTRFLTGTSGASLFGAIDGFAGSTNVTGWDFVVQVPCHNCTEWDVKTVLYYPETGVVVALDGLYGWDS